MKRICLQLTAAAVLLLPASWAQAVITCTVSSAGFTTSYNNVLETVPSSFTVTCQRNAGFDATSLTYRVRAAPTGTNTASSGGNTINYDVYTDSGCGTEWAAGGSRLPNPAGSMTLSGFAPTTSPPISFWGCVPAGQTSTPQGIYTDTVTMTVRMTPSSGGARNYTGTFPVAIHRGASCSISNAPGSVALNYTSFGPPANANTTFGATCTNQLPYTMSLDTTSGTLLGLNYSLALSAASATGTGVEQTYTITGTMAAGQVGTCATTTCSASQPHTLTINY